MRQLAVVDEREKTIYVEVENGIVHKYHLGMYAAALDNPRYWDDAFIETLNERKIPEIILED
jgi:hypothetical protein